jgi:hypothetical protein
MALWSLDLPPRWRKKNGKKQPVLTNRGWEDPDTGEVLVAMAGRTEDAGSANIVGIQFDAAALAQGDPLSVTVVFNENVDVVGGATIEVSSTGGGGNITLHAAAQTGVSSVVFNLQVDLLTPETVPLETADLSIAAQSILGTVTDTVGGAASDVAIGAAEAAEAGVISVA